MKLTKRILCLLLVLALTFALCACGKKGKTENINDDERSNNLPIPSDTTTSAKGDATTGSTAGTTEGNLGGDVHYNDATLAW